MLTPKTIAMNAAKAPHWTLYRRTANMRNHPRTVPMRTRPTWLMSNESLRDHRNAPPPRIKYAPQFSREITSSESQVPSSCALRCDASLWTVRKLVGDTRLSSEIARPNLWEGMVNSGRLHGPCERRGYRRQDREGS